MLLSIFIMFIYNGNLGNCQYGPNETITVVFPARFELEDPVSAYWQWSNDPKLNKKTSVVNVRMCVISPCAHTLVV